MQQRHVGEVGFCTCIPDFVHRSSSFGSGGWWRRCCGGGGWSLCGGGSGGSGFRCCSRGGFRWGRQRRGGRRGLGLLLTCEETTDGGGRVVDGCMGRKSILGILHHDCRAPTPHSTWAKFNMHRDVYRVTVCPGNPWSGGLCMSKSGNYFSVKQVLNIC